MMKQAWLMASVAILAIAACKPNETQTNNNSPASPASTVVGSTNVAASSASAPLTALPASCQQMLANLERCVAKQEKLNASEAQSYRMEFEMLKDQIVRGTDAKGLDEACTKSNEQAKQMPETQC